MTLNTRNAVSTSRIKASNAVARARQARQAEQARRAAAQIAPLARGVQVTARRGVYSSRAWAAPRLELTGRMIQERAAPRLAAMMTAAAHRIEPPRQRGRRRSVVAIGGVILAAGSAVAAIVLSRRGGLSSMSLRRGEGTPAAAEPETPGAKTQEADINRHAHTS